MKSVKLRTQLSRAVWLAAAAAVVAVPVIGVAGELDTAIEFTLKANRLAAASQAKVDKLDEDAFDMLQEYRELQRQIESLRIYNNQVAELVTNQDTEVESMRQQIDDAVLVGREITPLMLKMIDSLESFIELDYPFLKDERAKRVERLRRMMTDPNVTDSEKFRQVMEAYSIENSYGRTIEDYDGKLGTEGDDRTVQFLRVGRIVLLYMTVDGEEAGRWDNSARQWQTVDSSYFNEIRKGLRIARKQAAPDLMRLPVSAPATEAAAPVPPPAPKRVRLPKENEEEEQDDKKGKK
ncbi:MAG: DUF3450 domain-containing protein [Myxococcota bacterium]